MNIINTLENIRNSKITLGILLVTLLGVYQSSSAAVPTRQIISNMAIGEYTENGSNRCSSQPFEFSSNNDFFQFILLI